mgnify:CR=1 FL=1
MNIEIDSILLEINYRSGGLKGLLKVKICNEYLTLFYIDFLLKDYDNLKELCRNGGNSYKFIKDDKFSALANFKIKQNISEIPISEYDYDGDHPIKLRENDYNQLSDKFYYNYKKNVLESTVPIVYIYKKSILKRFFELFKKESAIQEPEKLWRN